MRRIRKGGLSRYGNPLRRGFNESRGRDSYLNENFAHGTPQKETFNSVRDILNQGIVLDNGGFDFEYCKFKGVSFTRDFKGKLLRFMTSNSKYIGCDFSNKIVEIDGTDERNVFDSCKFNNSIFTVESYFYKCTFDDCWFKNVTFKTNQIIFEKCEFTNRDVQTQWDWRTELGDTRKNFKNCTMNGNDFASEMRDDLH